MWVHLHFKGTRVQNLTQKKLSENICFLRLDKGKQNYFKKFCSENLGSSDFSNINFEEKIAHLNLQCKMDYLEFFNVQFAPFFLDRI